jgi:hypothetical protein
MKEKLKKWLWTGLYAIAMTAMAASLTLEELRPQALADTCPSSGTPCNLTNGEYVCTGGMNGSSPIPGCACDLSNFCTGEVR